MKQNRSASLAALCLVLAAFLYSCEQEKKPASAVEKLLGAWEITDDRDSVKTYIEEWSKEEEHVYTGTAYVLNITSGEKFNAEQLRLEWSDGAWTYLASPNGQEPTPFSVAVDTVDRVRFVNPEHDFPQYIQYHWITADSMQVEIGDSSTSMKWMMLRKP